MKTNKSKEKLILTLIKLLDGSKYQNETKILITKYLQHETKKCQVI